MEIKELERAAKKFEEDAKKLREAAQILSRAGAPETADYNGTRADQLAKFIEKHGGAAERKLIIAESGIPAGTVASLLGSKKKFEKDRRGFWHPKQRVKRKEQAEVTAETVPA